MELFTPREGQPHSTSDRVQERHTTQSSSDSEDEPNGPRISTPGARPANRIAPNYPWEPARSNGKSFRQKVARGRWKRGRWLIGLEPNQRIKQHHDGSEYLLWSQIRSVLQEPFSEFLGVLVFTMIQQGGVAQTMLSVGETTAPGGAGYGSYLTIPLWQVSRSRHLVSSTANSIQHGHWCPTWRLHCRRLRQV